jgi:hypothetical protein
MMTGLFPEGERNMMTGLFPEGERNMMTGLFPEEGRNMMTGLFPEGEGKKRPFGRSATWREAPVPWKY